MSARLIDLEYSKLHPTIRDLSEAGVTAEDAAWIRQGNAARVAQFIREQRGLANIIDLDADPVVPDGWTVEEHKKGGQWKFDPDKVELYLSKRQQGGKYINGNKLRKELEGKPVLNTNVLDYLLEHPHLIPEEWKDKYVFFWGTVYRHRGGDLCVRYLYRYGGGWHWDHRWLGLDWGDRSPAVVRAS